MEKSTNIYKGLKTSFEMLFIRTTKRHNEYKQSVKKGKRKMVTK